MKRKVIQLAKKTLVVSIPSKWASRRGLVKGQEIDIEEEGERLVISSGKEKATEKKSIEVSKADCMLVRIVAGLYKAGYDEVELTFSTSKELHKIQDVLRKTWVGFEVTSQGKNYIEAREISKSDASQFDTALRRMFLFILSIGEEAVSAMRSSDKESLEILMLRDENVNRLADFCRRVINKQQGARQGPLYCIVEELEKIGDIYRDISKLAINNEIGLSKETEKLFAALNKYLREFYELFYSFELERLEQFGKKKGELDSLLNKCMKISSKKNMLLLFLLGRLLESTYDLNGPLVTARL